MSSAFSCTGEQVWPAYQVEGGVDGDICCHADDTTLSISDKDSASLSAKLSRKYMEISQFMVNNKLKLNDDKTHLKTLNMRLGAIRKIRSLTNFKNRKMIAEGVFMSKLSYLIALWGGWGKVLKQSLQRIQNKAAQAVTRNDWSVTSRENLKQCGWISVSQLAFFHSVFLVYKTRQNKRPRYLCSMHNSTRQAETGLIRVLSKPSWNLPGIILGGGH